MNNEYFGHLFIWSTGKRHGIQLSHFTVAAGFKSKKEQGDLESLHSLSTPSTQFRQSRHSYN